MVRISDARMSGTSFGTVVLHVAPESAIGGPLALVETGDEIELDVGRRRIELMVAAEESSAGVPKFQPPAQSTSAGTAGCSWTTSRRPIWAAISTF